MIQEFVQEPVMRRKVLFYLGTHQPHWLAKVRFPLFLSVRTLTRIKKHKPANCRYAIDSGGFSELSMHGEWKIPPQDYVDRVRGWTRDIGTPDWAAIQDWMCEDLILAKTRRSISDHQELSCKSLADLTTLAPEVSWTPVIQGRSLEDYLRHVELYAKWGLPLRERKIVGVGSICRIQSTTAGVDLVNSIYRETGLPIHAFGFKKRGLPGVVGSVVSSDSLAWSFAGRRSAPLPGHEVRHKNCANCLEYAELWRKSLSDLVGGFFGE